MVDPPREMKTILDMTDNSSEERMKGLPNQSKRPRTHSSCVTQLGDIIDANPSSYGRSYDQRVIVDHGK